MCQHYKCKRSIDAAHTYQREPTPLDLRQSSPFAGGHRLESESHLCEAKTMQMSFKYWQLEVSKCTIPVSCWHDPSTSTLNRRHSVERRRRAHQKSTLSNIVAYKYVPVNRNLQYERSDEALAAQQRLPSQNLCDRHTTRART